MAQNRKAKLIIQEITNLLNDANFQSELKMEIGDEMQPDSCNTNEMSIEWDNHEDGTYRLNLIAYETTIDGGEADIHCVRLEDIKAGEYLKALYDFRMDVINALEVKRINLYKELRTEFYIEVEKYLVDNKTNRKYLKDIAIILEAARKNQ